MTSEAKAWGRFVAAIASLAIVFGAAVPRYLNRYALAAPSVAAIYCCFVLLVILVITPGMRASRAWISRRRPSRKKLFVAIALWCVPYLIYAVGTNDFRWTGLFRLLAMTVPLVFIYVAFPVMEVYKLAWQDVMVGAWLMCSVLLHQLNGIWNVPVNLDFMTRLFLVSVAGWCWVFVRPVPGLGYEFSINRRVLKAAGFNFVFFGAIAIPAALAMHFVAWNPQSRGMAAFCLTFLEIFLFVAWLEELFFRGFLQNLISNSIGSQWRGQLIVSVLFGFSHIFHAPVPNWRYVVLASIAGWFYGSAFRNGGNLMACSLMHAMVDTAWRTWFGRV